MQALTAHGVARRTVGLVLLAAAAAGCQSAAVPKTNHRGASSDSAMTTVDNAFLVPSLVPGSCAMQSGHTAKLSFTVTNNRSVGSERLTSVVTDAASDIVIPRGGTAAIPAGGALTLGQPRSDSARATVLPAADVTGLRPQVRAATSLIVTFTFADAGQVTMQVPVEACPTQK